MARQLHRVTASFIRPADNTAYTAGDEISSNATAGSVVLPTFNVAGFRRVSIKRASLDVTPASGNTVVTAFAVSLLVFKTADAPTPVGDNVTAPIPGTSRNKAAKFAFLAAVWTAPDGSSGAGASGFNEVLPAVPTVNGNLLEFTGSEANGEVRTLTAYLQVTDAWTPLGVANTFNIWLDLELEP